MILPRKKVIQVLKDLDKEMYYGALYCVNYIEEHNEELVDKVT